MNTPCYQRPPIPPTKMQLVASAHAAKSLTHVGQPVILRREDNRPLHTLLETLPERGATGLWTVRVQSYPGAHDCTRVVTIPVVGTSVTIGGQCIGTIASTRHGPVCWSVQYETTVTLSNGHCLRWPFGPDSAYEITLP